MKENKDKVVRTDRKILKAELSIGKVLDDDKKVEIDTEVAAKKVIEKKNVK